MRELRVGKWHMIWACFIVMEGRRPSVKQRLRDDDNDKNKSRRVFICFSYDATTISTTSLIREG
jgi:hypothetical protein